MYLYELCQWLLFFFIYCFLGWVWESCYVSAKSGHWVNRGFLHGPLLPIYGSGAIIVLFLTLPVRENIPLIFLLGMTGATVLEYVTGALMEKLFGVRYWDYSKQFCNLNGHICLGCSLGWGVFSVLLVRVIHKPVEQLVLAIPMAAAQCLSAVILIGFTVDFTMSFQAALDLKELLHSLWDRHEELGRLQKRIDAAAAALGSEREAIRERVAQLSGRLPAIPRRRHRGIRSLLRRNPGVVSGKFQTWLDELKKEISEEIKK